MAYVRKRRNTPVIIKEEAPHQDGEGSTNKNSRRKRKLSDMLGPQWTKEDLEHFYKAYRKYGKDWKKVAAAVHDRTAEMVAALYNMNRAYLSLPDQAGSAAGFIAMMIDHYNMLDVSNSDGDYTEGYEGSQCLLQQTQLKNKLNNTGTFDECHLSLLHSRSTSSFDCSPPVKKRTGGSRARVVGKRIPWFHVSYIIEKKSSETVPLCKEEPDLGSDVDYNPSEVAKADPSALAEVSFQAVSPRVSRTPTRRTQDVKYSLVQNGDLKGSAIGNESRGSGAKHFGSPKVESSSEDCRESRVAGKRVTTKSKSSVLHGKSGAASASNVKSKMKKLPMNLLELQGAVNVHSDDVRDELTCTAEGIGVKEDNERYTPMGKHGKNGKKLSSQQARKRSRQLFSGDGNSGLNALATLADLSLNGLLPPPIADLDMSVHFKVEKNENDISEKAKISEQEVGDDLQTEKSKMSLEQERGSDDSDAVKSVGLEAKLKHHEQMVSTELKGQHTTSLAEFKRRKRKAAVEKPPQVEALRESCLGETHKVEAQISLVYERKVRKKPKGMINTNEPLNNSKLIEPVKARASAPELTLLSGCSTESVIQNTAVNQATLPSKHCRKQKLSPKKASAEKTGVSEHGVTIAANAHCEPVNFAAAFCPHTMTDETAGMKAQLTHCLSSAKLRQWCIYEWFYSAIDFPWFERNEFVEYLNHAGLGHVPRLTHVEWGVIRSSLGKPRRLSKRFLQEEREKLEQYRESVRKHYNEVHAGTCDALPTDLALPLSVGQRVIAFHPKSREIHDGSILKVEQNGCRVQFDRPEVAVEFVLDIDCMPVNPLENMPQTLTRKRVILDNLGCGFEDTKLYIKSRAGWNGGGDARAVLDERLDNRGMALAFAPPSKYSFNTLLNQEKGDTDRSVNESKAAKDETFSATQHAMYHQPCALTPTQSREADVRALSDLARALDKKEALLVELRHMNDEISTNQKNGESVRNSEPFRKQYASVLLQLKVANDQVTSALVSLRRRNTYQVNMIPPWHCAISHSLGTGSSISSQRVASHSFDTSKRMGEIANNAKIKARMMVDAAMKAVASTREGEDTVVKIGAALDSLADAEAHSDSVKVRLDPSHFDSGKDAEPETLKFHQSSIATSGPELTAEDAPGGKMEVPSDTKERLLLAELIASCVATLLMIQACSERQYLPSEVAHVLENAVRSVQPYSTANLIIYREIQQYMGIVKNQILALIPTQSSISVSADPPSGSK